MAKTIMIQGTMSDVGKSLIVAGLCRVFKQDGWRVAPFKAQNMALNSWITDEGLEMGRAQVMQAEACGINASVLMNPVLLKPTTDMGAQVIVNGEVRGNMMAEDYFGTKINLMDEVLAAFGELSKQYDIIVIEGAGSPAEINLRERDIVNMGLAKRLHTPVLLAGDIDRGGVFAQLCGTLLLLEDDERELVKGLIINKFRGDINIFKPGIGMLEERSGKRVIGVLPWLDVDIEEEDNSFGRSKVIDNGMMHTNTVIDIAIIRLPRISNFTDVYALEATPGITVRGITRLRDLKNPDVLIIPGSKNTISDLLWMRQTGLEAAVLALAKRGVVVFGICGGYQMLGERIVDSEGIELRGGGSVAGMGLLPVETIFENKKIRKQVKGRVNVFGGCSVDAYEIHQGRTKALSDMDVNTLVVQNNNVYGTYLHGFFDDETCRSAFCSFICEKKGVPPLSEHSFDLKKYKEEQYDKLAEAVRNNLDMQFIYKVLEMENENERI
jgi:adenosylcobyric acid synthase